MIRSNGPVLFLSVVLALLAAYTANAQITKGNCQGWGKVPNVVLPFVYLVPNGSQVALENGRAYLDDKRRLVKSVVLRNRTNKTIRSVRVTLWHLGGGGGDWLPILIPGGLAAGKTFTLGGGVCTDAPELSNKELDTMGIPGDRIASMIVVFLQEVAFSDGSIQSDEGMTQRFWDYQQDVFVENEKKGALPGDARPR